MIRTSVTGDTLSPAGVITAYKDLKYVERASRSAGIRCEATHRLKSNKKGIAGITRPSRAQTRRARLVLGYGLQELEPGSLKRLWQSVYDLDEQVRSARMVPGRLPELLHDLHRMMPAATGMTPKQSRHAR